MCEPARCCRRGRRTRRPSANRALSRDARPVVRPRGPRSDQSRDRQGVVGELGAAPRSLAVAARMTPGTPSAPARTVMHLLIWTGLLVSALSAVGCEQRTQRIPVEPGRVRPLVIEHEPPSRVIVEHRRPAPGPVIVPRKVIGPPVIVERRLVGPPAEIKRLPPPTDAERRPPSMLHPDDAPVIYDRRAAPSRQAQERERKIKERERK